VPLKCERNLVSRSDSPIWGVSDWQTSYMFRKRASLGVLSILVASVATACTSSNSLSCDGIHSVAGFVASFAQGLDNFSENQYTQLRLDTLDAYDTVSEATKDTNASLDAFRLQTSLKSFIGIMDEVDWDVSQAVANPRAITSAAALGSQVSLRRANSVEAFVIQRCGLPTTIDPSDSGAVRLPDPLIPSPTATDPTTDTIDEKSESTALGEIIANIFSLTLSSGEVQCLGSTLVGVADFSSSQSNISEYQAQFQRAFDSCGINFTIPKD
jgi:hypothetical protein